MELSTRHLVMWVNLSGAMVFKRKTLRTLVLVQFTTDRVYTHYGVSGDRNEVVRIAGIGKTTTKSKERRYRHRYHERER